MTSCSSESITILRNDTPRVATYVTGICTELEYFDLSVAREPPAEAARSLRYFVPVVELPGMPSVVFERTDGVTPAAAFLAHEFPQAFPDLSGETFAAVALARQTRQLYTGDLFELRSPASRAYGFSLLLPGRANPLYA